MSQTKHHLVTIKGTKDGLTSILDDHCAYEEMISELEEKLSSKHYQQDDGRVVRVNILVGNRYITQEQEDELREIITEGKNLFIEKIDSDVISKLEAEELCRSSQIHSVAKVVRSGQVLEFDGDLLLIGDVNPGGAIIVSGNIYILGALRGMAHAGCNGNIDSVIAASIMAPSQLRIAEYIHQEPDRVEQVERVLECAYVDHEKNEICTNHIQQVQKIRPFLANIK